MAKTTSQLAAMNVAMLKDPDACPTVPLQDVACEIADRYEAALAALVSRIQAESDAEYEAHIAKTADKYGETIAYTKSWSSKPDTFAVDLRRKGWRFARIWRTSYYNVCRLDDGTEKGAPSRSVVGFVEAGTGLLWKAATWKAPALNFPRGCIFDLPDDWECGGSFDTLTATSTSSGIG